MKSSLLGIVYLLLLTSCSGYLAANNLDSEMNRLNVNTALIISSNAIDEYPLWSQDSTYIAVNIMGKWHKVRLSHINLIKEKWRQMGIGVLVVKKDVIEEISITEKNDLDKGVKFGARELITENKTKIKLKLSGLSTSLNIERKGEKPSEVWRSSVENCHSMTLSPDEKYFTYLCEISGLFVMKLF